MVLTIVVCISTILVFDVSCLPNGAHPNACVDMVPGHIPNQATGPAPFQIRAMPMNNGQVMVHVNATSDVDFKGFMIMAKDESSQERGHGYFIATPDSKKIARHMNCEGFPKSCNDPAACQGTANALTHSSNEFKKSVTAVWTPPTQMSGHDIIFVATVVVKFDTWYEGLASNSVLV
ncbi:hypothetical protein TCAL_04873 [Tigriopus californicus]|uniref:Reelin domain-containing protein n=1 Tax=Tigriopus californicus TaxID=6832 RepID=A0A553NZE9_TIGCA|nr:putative defense protein Hdd11-like [Tigriopus californicus]TRY70824.1 hypothetical protein TCAL_04873 [Tigriopus californicus]|eukprot:TCALIF_04873-PA protein Name:"Similar to frrs1 Putative ferric-chelate reductase 1 (Danio rerio)" AED:0.18 eAED:0.30 QI:0/0/0/0.5/1/1/2/0/176